MKIFSISDLHLDSFAYAKHLQCASSNLKIHINEGIYENIFN